MGKYKLGTSNRKALDSGKTLGTSNGKGLGTSNGKGLGTSNGRALDRGKTLGTSNGKGLGLSRKRGGGFLQSMRSFFSEEPDEPDKSIEEQIDEIPTEFVPSPILEGEKEFYQARPFSGTRSERIAPEKYYFREEHEPYRFEPDGDKVVCISKSYLYEIHPLTNSVTRHALTPLRIKVLSTKKCVVYSRYTTDNHGHVKVVGVAEGEKKIPSYELMVGEALPPSTNFELPNDTGSGGIEGEYFVPICYFVKGRFDRKQFDSNDDGREAQLMGSLEGHRGPMWWISGYNALKNLGTGAKVYKNYTRDDDFKNLRSLKEKGQTRNCAGDNKISGLPQVKVAESSNGNEIEIHGNRFNKTWKVGDKRQAIIEDGLVRCIGDLLVEELEPVTVVAAPTTTSNSTTSVAAYPTSTQRGEAWSGGAVNPNMIQGTPHSTMWAGGTERTLSWVTINTTNGDYYVLGQSAGSGSTAPANVTYVDSPTQVTGVTSAVQITGVANTTTSDLDPVNVIKDLTSVSIVSNTNTTEVFKSTGSNLRVVKESTGDECNTCPEE